jgi:cell division protein FtsW
MSPVRGSTAHPTMLPASRRMTFGYVLSRLDPWLVGSTLALLGLGCALVYSASAGRGESLTGDHMHFLVRHLGVVALGLGMLCVVVQLPTSFWSRAAYPLLAVTALFLLLLFVPGLGRRVNGAMRWLSLPGLQFQPAELAKFSVVLYLAQSLAKKREKVTHFSQGFLPHVLVTGVIACLVLLQPDFGTAAVVYATLALMLFVAGVRARYLLALVFSGMPVVFLYVWLHAHAWNRLVAFLEPEQHRLDVGYQLFESLVAVGSGRWHGVGLGMGHQKLQFLPEAHTDFIFAVLAQELGFVGVVAVVAAFGILVGRGLWLARHAHVRFASHLAFGISCWLGLQALVHIAVTVALLPTKGLTLPFVSFGRTSILVSILAIGVLMRIGVELLAFGPKTSQLNQTSRVSRSRGSRSGRVLNPGWRRKVLQRGAS